MEINNKIEWTREHMPVLKLISQEFLETKPFKGLIIGCCLHLTKETAILLMAIKDGGAKVFATASNPLSTQNDVVGWINGQDDIYVFGVKGMGEKEYHDGLIKVVEANCDYIIDDGADLTDAIHKYLYGDQNKINIPKGGLEETTTGVTRIKNMKLKYPILAVNDAQTKHFFDNVYGTGQSTIDAIMRSTNILLAGKNFVVCGYGYCGKGLANRARGMGCNVIVTEIDPVKALQAKMDGFNVMKIGLAVFEADVVVTVTGNINVLDEDIRDLKDGVIIANAGHFDVEINKKVLKDNAKNIRQISDDITEYELGDNDIHKRIYLLSDGRLVNLSAAEGHPSEVMDMSFANQALGLEWMVKNQQQLYYELKDNKGIGEVIDMPIEIDRKIAALKLKALGIEIDKETEEQANYIKE